MKQVVICFQVFCLICLIFISPSESFWLYFTAGAGSLLAGVLYWLPGIARAEVEQVGALVACSFVAVMWAILVLSNQPEAQHILPAALSWAAPCLACVPLLVNVLLRFYPETNNT